MSLRAKVKRKLLQDPRGMRVLSGPARGSLLVGAESLRVYAGLYEIELNKWIRTLVRCDDSVFDVGAQYGYDALLFARLTSGRILSIDSDSALTPIITANIARNSLQDRVMVRNAYVGDGSGDTLTLESLADETFRPDFVKMDIEGAEMEAIYGASSLLDTVRAWLIEVHSRDAERRCIEALAQHGYDLEFVNPRRWLPDRRPTEHNRWLIAAR